MHSMVWSYEEEDTCASYAHTTAHQQHGDVCNLGLMNVFFHRWAGLRRAQRANNRMRAVWLGDHCKRFAPLPLQWTMNNAARAGLVEGTWNPTCKWSMSCWWHRLVRCLARDNQLFISDMAQCGHVFTLIKSWLAPSRHLTNRCHHTCRVWHRATSWRTHSIENIFYREHILYNDAIRIDAGPENPGKVSNHDRKKARNLFFLSQKIRPKSTLIYIYRRIFFVHIHMHVCVCVCICIHINVYI